MKQILLSCALLFSGLFGLNAQVQNYTVGQSVNDFTVTDIHGNTHQLSQITGSGKWVLIDFFFTTCPPCQATVPYFSELHEKYGCNQGDLFCISIDTGDSDADVTNFENTYSTSSGHSPAPAVSGIEGGGNAVITDFGPGAYPTYCLIDTDMTIRNVDIWPVNSIAEFETAFAAEGFSPAVLSCAAGLEGIASLNEISVFPNPVVSNPSLVIHLNNASKVDVRIYSLVGDLVAEQLFNGEVGNNTFTLNTLDLVNGQYVIHVSAEDDVIHDQIQLTIVK